MTLTPADVVNRAIQLVGGFDNNGPVTGTAPLFDSTPVGIAAGTIYNAVVQTVARQSGWDFSRTIAALVLTGATPPLGYLYEYIYPSTAVQIRQLLPPSISDKNNPVPQRWTVGNSLSPSVQATGSITYVSNLSPGDTITLNATVLTAVAISGGSYDFVIGGTLAVTLQNLVLLHLTLPPLTADPTLNVATYTYNSTQLLITYNLPGVAGNNYTLAASSGTRSGATLTGGANAQQKVVWSDLASAVCEFTSQPPESTWDSLFTETVVRLMASELDLATAGKPDSSAAAFEQAAGFSKVGETRLES